MVSPTSSHEEHSIGGSRCQSSGSHDRADAADTRPDRQLEARYGRAALRHGYTAVPNLLLRHYVELEMSAAELVCVQHLLSFWWSREFPFPAVGTLAERMGKTVRQVQHYLAALQGKGLLRIIERLGSSGGRLPNAYDLRPLLALLGRLADRQAPEAPETSSSARPLPTQPLSARKTAPAPLKPASPKENAPSTYTPFDLDSIRACPAADTLEGSENEPLGRAMAAIGAQLGDAAPRSSLSRVLALCRAADLAPARLPRLLELARVRTLEHLDAVRRRNEAGRPNAMPYFFAVLTDLLAQRSARAAVRSRRAASPAPPTVTPAPRTGSPGAVPSPAPERGAERPPTLWDAVLAQLRGVVSPAVAERASRLRLLEVTPTELRLAAPCEDDRAWAERQLRRRIQEALADLGSPALEVQLGVEARAA